MTRCCMKNHALAFNTLLSSQETDAFIVIQLLAESAARGAHFGSFSLSDRLVLVKPPDPGASGLAPFGATLLTYSDFRLLSNQLAGGARESDSFVRGFAAPFGPAVKTLAAPARGKVHLRQRMDLPRWPEVQTPSAASCASRRAMSAAACSARLRTLTTTSCGALAMNCSLPSFAAT
ncbi:hypothetical protein SAMN05421874_1392 [Nonomuraea maritima]|uniref:Uncharacterized protein n=1 Tax=Nonomuraea maritima TaxID=683260 RepID=A0A1G9QIK2_9ACTN|nr:hypothetical protein SAMN05421874_1392 [Nonomuraea maritima]